MPIMLAGEAQPLQRCLAGPHTFVRPAVVETGEHAGDLLERSHGLGAAAGEDGFAVESRMDVLAYRLWGLAVEQLSVGHHHGREPAGGVAVNKLQGGYAVPGRFHV